MKAGPGKQAIPGVESGNDARVKIAMFSAFESNWFQLHVVGAVF